MREIVIDKVFDSNEVLDVFDNTSAIYGLSITMDINRSVDKGLVRILLEDSNGKKYLVAESYKEISNTKKNQNLSKYCEETALLEGINPSRLHIITNNAEVVLHSITILTDDLQEQKSSSDAFQKKVADLRKQQVQAKVNLINDYNNANQKLWTAGITELSLISFDDKMRILNLPVDASTWGFEYYIGGILEVGERDSLETNRSNQSSPYVPEFDWTNRHGTNWMTSVKRQGHSNYCVAFASLACVEALINLYYNKKIDFDLSEQEAACCNGSQNPYTNGMVKTDVLNYLKNYGVCDEDSYPFVDDPLQSYCQSDEINPQVKVKIDGYNELSNYTFDTMKEALIQHGPLLSGFRAREEEEPHPIRSHAMALVGYGTIQAGDSIREVLERDSLYYWGGYHNDYVYTGYYNIPENSPLIGKTFWKFKNSNNIRLNDDIDGYMYIMFHNQYSATKPYVFNLPFTIYDCINNAAMFSESDIICEDADGDGYYFWGLGQKPSFAPEGIPDVPDGDDSNPLLGQMNQYGFCEDLNPATRPVEIISVTQATSGMASQYSHIEVTNNATWTICHNRTFYNGARITIRNGSSIILTNGAILENVEIIMESGATLKILENGKIHLRDGIMFGHPVGAVVEVEYGEIS